MFNRESDLSFDISAFDSLPTELILRIFEYLTVQDLSMIALVCRGFEQIRRDAYRSEMMSGLQLFRLFRKQDYTCLPSVEYISPSQHDMETVTRLDYLLYPEKAAKGLGSHPSAAFMSWKFPSPKHGINEDGTTYNYEKFSQCTIKEGNGKEKTYQFEHFAKVGENCLLAVSSNLLKFNILTDTQLNKIFFLRSPVEIFAVSPQGFIFFKTEDQSIIKLSFAIKPRNFMLPCNGNIHQEEFLYLNSKFNSMLNSPRLPTQSKTLLTDLFNKLSKILQKPNAYLTMRSLLEAAEELIQTHEKAITTLENDFTNSAPAGNFTRARANLATTTYDNSLKKLSMKEYASGFLSLFLSDLSWTIFSGYAQAKVCSYLPPLSWKNRMGLGVLVLTVERGLFFLLKDMRHKLADRLHQPFHPSLLLFNPIANDLETVSQHLSDDLHAQTQLAVYRINRNTI